MRKSKLTFIAMLVILLFLILVTILSGLFYFNLIFKYPTGYAVREAGYNNSGDNIASEIMDARLTAFNENISELYANGG